MTWTGGTQRIFHVLFAPAVGGCESLCVELIACLERFGWAQEVVFLSDETGPMRDRLLQSRDLPIHICKYQRENRLRFVKRFATLCRVRRIDKVLAYSFGLHFFVALGAKLGLVKQVFALVGNPPPPEPRTRLLAMLLSQLGRPFVTNEVACSRYVADQIARGYRLPNRRISVLLNCCDVNGIAARAELARRNRKQANPILGVVARLDPIKDHVTIVRAFSRFREHFPQSRLRLLGDGSLRGCLERLAQDLGLLECVEFLGTRLDVPEQLGRLDMFVYATTENEGFGIALAEAMAAKVPIVATDIGPCAEVLKGGAAGLLVPPRDPEALAAGMEKLWLNRNLQMELVSAAFDIAKAHYSIEAASCRLLEMFREC